MTERLTPEELAALRVRLIEGRRVDLSLLAYEDQLALRPFDWKRRRAERAAEARAKPFAESTTGEVDEVGEIADRLVAAISGTPLQNPRTFLRDAPPEKLSALLNARDFSRIMELRSQIVRPSQPKPAAPKASREQITSDVMARRARGESLDDIARSVGIPYSLAMYITDTTGDPQ